MYFTLLGGKMKRRQKLILIVFSIVVIITTITSFYISTSQSTQTQDLNQTQITIYQTMEAVYHSTQTEQAIEYTETARANYSTQTEQAGVYTETARANRSVQTEQAVAVAYTMTAIENHSAQTEQAVAYIYSETAAANYLVQTERAIAWTATPTATNTQTHTPPTLLPESLGRIWINEDRQDAFIISPDREITVIENGQPITEEGVVIISNESHLIVELNEEAYIEILPHSLLSLDSISDIEHGLEITVSSGNIIITSGNWSRVITNDSEQIEIQRKE
jgi:hypothetical protein